MTPTDIRTGSADRLDAMERLFARDYSHNIFSIDHIDFVPSILSAFAPSPPQRIVLRGRPPKHRIADPVKKAARLRQKKARAKSRSTSK